VGISSIFPLKLNYFNFFNSLLDPLFVVNVISKVDQSVGSMKNDKFNDFAEYEAQLNALKQEVILFILKDFNNKATFAENANSFFGNYTTKSKTVSLYPKRWLMQHKKVPSQLDNLVELNRHWLATASQRAK
jgi:hypothetical protein